MNFKNIPIYRISINLDDEETGMTAISMVDEPAILTNWLAFDKQESVMKFQIESETEHKVTGPAIICDMPIYRWSFEMGEYYVVFDKKAIEDIVFKYSKNNLWNQVDLQHDGVMINGATLVEYYIKDAAKGKNPAGYEDVSDGSLFCTYQITDDELWNQIISSGELNGFSIEINAELEPTEQVIDDGQEEDEDFDAWLDELLAWLMGEDIDVEFADDVKKKFDIIEQSIDDNEEIKIKVHSRTYKGQAYTTFVNDGSRNVALYDGKKWHVINETEISSVETTGNKNTVDWSKALTSRDYDWVRELIRDENTSDIKRVATVPKNEYERAIIEHRWVNITYDDQTDNNCKSSRQCMVMEYGYTTANNAAIRIYEQFGATHHPEDMPGWRTLRLDRITSFKINNILEPYTEAPAGFRHDGQGQDKDGFLAILRSDL